MTTLTRSAIASIALIALAAACGDDSPSTAATAPLPASSSPVSPAPTTAAPPATTSLTTESVSTTAAATTAAHPTTEVAEAEVADVPEVIVLEPGAEPRQLVRLAIEPGVSTLTMHQVQEIVQSLDGVDAPGAGPIGTDIVQRFEVTPGPDGLYDVTSVVVDAVAADDVDPDLADVMNEALTALVGARTTSTIDDRGRLIEADVDEESLSAMPDFLASMITQLAEQTQLATPLPEEPVGVGARWQVLQRLDVGVDIDQTLTYELVAIDGAVLTLEMTGTQTPLGDSMELPGTGLAADIVEWTFTTTGTMVLDLTHGFAQSEASTEGHQVFDVPGQGELDQTVRLALTITSRRGE